MWKSVQQMMEPTSFVHRQTDKWVHKQMIKENMEYIHNVKLYSHKENQKYIIWRDGEELEINLLNEMNQAQKGKYHIFL